MNFLDELKSGKYNFTKDGKCTRCGACCGDLLPIGDNDILRIRNYLKLHPVQECRHLAPTSSPTEDDTCPFRDNDRRICTIYAARPEICRDYICSLPASGKGLDIEKYRKQHTRPQSMRELFFKK